TLRCLADHPTPKRERGEALIRVLFAGICNTDVELMKGYMGFEGILGHEFVGVVEECDDQEWVGERVVGEINCGCGKCELCQNGFAKHCPERTVLGILDRNGAFADYLTLPVENLHGVPDSITDEEAVFVEPLAAAFRIVEQAAIASSDRVIVLGDGKLGLLVGQVLQLTGCGLTVIGRHQSKLEILQHRGIETSLDGQYGGKRADIVVDCTGSPEGFESVRGLVRPQGTLILKSTFSERLNLDLTPVVIDEITVVGSRCGPFGPAIDALAEKAVDVRPLITRTVPLEKAREAFDLASEGETLKVLLKVAP
ncbi:MAG: alcohol dehydrogenase catalytic domain-containing protein, partial [bacterium]